MAVDIEVAAPGAPVAALTRPRFPFLAPLGVRAYALYWAAGILIWADEYVKSLAIASLSLDLTGRPSGLANVLSLSAIPVTLLMLVGGLAADRFRPHRVVMGAVLARAATAGTLAALAASEALVYWHLLVYALVSGVISGFFIGAYFSVLPDLLPPERVRSANSLTQVTENLARFVVPPLAGVLVAAAGAPPALAIAAACALGAGCLMGAIRLAPRASRQEGRRSPVAQLAEGFRAARMDEAVWTWIWTGGVLVCGITFGMVVGFPALAKLVLNAGDEGIGLLTGSLGAGALVGALLTGAIRSVRRPGVVVGAAGLAQGLLLVVVASVASIWVAVPLVVVSGALEAVRVVLVLTMLQTRLDPEVRGRVMSIAALAAFGLNPVALALAGVVGDALGPRSIVALGGLVLALGAGLPLARRAVREARLE